MWEVSAEYESWHSQETKFQPNIIKVEDVL